MIALASPSEQSEHAQTLSGPAPRDREVTNEIRNSDELRRSVAAELSWAELELNSDQLRANRVATGSTPLSGRVGGVRPGSIHQSDFRVWV